MWAKHSAKHRPCKIKLDEDVSVFAIHMILGALGLGVWEGRKDGEIQMKKQVKYALDALSGLIDGSGLQDAADDHYHRLSMAAGGHDK